MASEVGVQKLIDGLNTLEGKTQFIYQIIDKEKVPVSEIDERDLNNAIEFYVDNSNNCYENAIVLSHAAEGYIKGMTEKTDKLFEEAKEYYKRKRLSQFSARLAKKIGKTQEAKKLYEEAIVSLVEEGRFGEAGELSEEAGMKQEAINHYRTAEQFEIAARLAEELGDTDLGQEIYIQAMNHYGEQGYYESAGKLASKLNLPEKEIEYLLKRHMPVKAKTIAHENDMIEKEIEICMQLRDGVDYAVDAALEHGMVGLGIIMYIEDKQFLKAAELAEELNMPEIAQILYEGVEIYGEHEDDFLLVAKTSRKLNNNNKSDEFYKKELERLEKKGMYESAAEVAEEAGMLERAQMYRAVLEILN